MDDIEDPCYYAKIAMLAYRSPYYFRDSDIDLLEGAIPQFIDVNNSQALVFTRGNTLVVAFRGADTCEDIYSNLHMHMTALSIGHVSCGYVHTGFLNYYSKIRREVMFAVHHHLKEDFSRPIAFVGHSLGATACMLAALECALITSNVSCYTYGSPRVGNQEFVDVFSRTVMNNYRFVNRMDPIIQLPSPIFYRHPRRAFYLGDSMRCIDYIAQVILLCVFSSCTQRCMIHHDIRSYIRHLMRRRHGVRKLSHTISNGDAEGFEFSQDISKDANKVHKNDHWEKK